MKIKDEILEILKQCRAEGDTVYLPDGQLDRKTYLAVDKCLADLGGKWNRKTKGHLFDRDIEEAFEVMLATGETENMKKKFQFFPTPRPVAEIVCDTAELQEATNILEPSCGKGDLADVIYEQNQNLVCIELNSDMKKHLDKKPYACMVGIDFLEYSPETIKPFDRIVMNPPFAKQQDIAHIRHAYDFLEPGGILAAVCSPSPFWREDKKSVAFREWLEETGAEVVDVPAKAFKESGTAICTKIVKIVKRREA